MNNQIFKLMRWKQEKWTMNDFDKGKTMMAWWLGESISKTEGLEEHSQSVPTKMVQDRKTDESAAGSWVSKAPIHYQSAYNEQKFQNWTVKQWKNVAFLMQSIFVYIMWLAGCVCIASLWKRWHQDSLLKECKLAKATRYCKQCYVGPGIHVDVTLT